MRPANRQAHRSQRRYDERFADETESGHKPFKMYTAVT